MIVEFGNKMEKDDWKLLQTPRIFEKLERGEFYDYD